MAEHSTQFKPQTLQDLNRQRRKINDLDDFYNTVEPASAKNNFDYEYKLGIGGAFIKGVKDVPEGYNPTLAEGFASVLTEFVRTGTDVAYEVFSPEQKRARESIERVRKYDPEFADKLEKRTIGARPSDKELAIRGISSLAEGALTVVPFFKAGRMALALREAQLVAKLSKTGKLGKIVAGSRVGRGALSGGLYGSIYGGLFPLQQGEGFKEAGKGAVVGGLAGMALLGLVGVGGIALSKSGRVVGAGVESVQPLLKKFTDKIPADLYRHMFSQKAVLQKYFGDVGDNFLKLYTNVTKEINLELAKLQFGFIKHGLIKPPSIAKKAFDRVKYIGDDTDLMNHYNRVLRGMGKFSDSATQRAAIEADARLLFLDEIRKKYGVTAQKGGLTINLFNLETYLPKYTPIQKGNNPIKLSSKTEKAIAAARTQAQIESAYASNDLMVRDMVENAVFNEKAFKNLKIGYETYYDYAEFVNSGARRAKKDNKFIRWMIRKGIARNENDAAAKLIRDNDKRKLTFTPRASSLDFKREVNLPWYDPNPSRVLPVYSTDAVGRINFANTFGKDDEVIKKMINTIRKNTEVTPKQARADAVTFDRVIRRITKQIENETGSTAKVSAFLRGIQTPKLAFAQILNIGQNLNYLVATDLGSMSHGLQQAFTREGLRKSIKDGVLLGNFMNQVFEHSGGSSDIANFVLKYTGFTYSEMFNRVVGSGVSERWAIINFNKLLKTEGVKATFATKAVELQVGITSAQKLNKTVSGIIKKAQKLIDSGKEAQAMTVLQDVTFVTETGLRELLNDGVTNVSKLERNTHGLFFQSPEPSYWLKVKTKNITETLASLASFAKNTSQESFITAQKMTEKVGGSWGWSSRFTDNLSNTKILEIQKIFNKRGIGLTINQATGEAVAYNIKVWDNKTGTQWLLGMREIKEALTKANYKYKGQFSKYKIGVYENKNYDKLISQSSRPERGAISGGIERGVEEGRDLLGGRAVRGDPSGFPQQQARVTSLVEARKFKTSDEFVDSVGKESRKLFDFQDTNQEVLIHKNWKTFIGEELKLSIGETFPPSLRNTLEGTGDIFREATQVGAIDSIYITEKVTRLEKFISFGKKHDDVLSKEYALETNKLKELRNLWNKQPTLTKQQQIAKELNLAVIDNNIPKIQEFLSKIKNESFYSKSQLTDIFNQAKTAGAVLKSNFDNSFEYRALSELGIDVEAAVSRGHLSNDDLIIAAQVLVERTQFLNRPIDLPSFASHPVGKVFTQFKSFAYQQARFLSREMGRESRAGNTKRTIRTLLILGTIYPMTGEVLADIRSLITGSKRPTKFLDRYISNIFQAGTYGLFYDFIQSARYGKTAEALAGVTGGDAFRYLEVLVSLGDPKEAMTKFSQQLLKQTGVGRILLNRVYKTKTKGRRTFYEDLQEWSGDQ